MVTLHLQPTESVSCCIMVCLRHGVSTFTVCLHSWYVFVHGVSASRCICVMVYLHSLCVFIHGVSASRCVCVTVYLHSPCVFIHGVSLFTVCLCSWCICIYSVSAFMVCPNSWCVRIHGVSVSRYVCISMCQHHRVSKHVRVPAGLVESSQPGIRCRSPLKLQSWFCRCEYKQTHGIAGWAW